MKVRTIHETEFADTLPADVLREIQRVSNTAPTEQWLNRYVQACTQLHNEGILDYRRNELFRMASQWIDSGRVKEGHDLQWAAANLWWAADLDGLVSALQYVADEWRTTNKREAKLAAWLSDNIPWGKRKIVTYQDLENLASKLEASGKAEEARILLKAYADFPVPKDPTVVATLSMPWRRKHGESRIENPSVLLVMLLEGKA